MSLSFVNIHGQSVDTTPRAYQQPAKKKTKVVADFHKGFLVVGISPAALTEAQRLHKEVKKDPRPFNVEQFLRTASKRRVRSKPYQLREAAIVCMGLAEKAGWLATEITELKQGGDK